MSDYRHGVALMFTIWRDCVASLAPHMDRQGLYWCICQLRAEPGSGALWQGIHEPWAAQRDELRYQLVELAEKTGDPWPFPTDCPPRMPDDASSLSA